MVASIIDGKHVAAELKNKIRIDVIKRVEQGYQKPGLAVVIIGDDPASVIYVNSKRRACEEVGFNSYHYNLPLKTSEKKLLSLIDELNESCSIHGILVQLPLPKHINTQSIIERIHPNKDVDGFHPYNLGRLAQGSPQMVPCTPYGVMRLFAHYHIPLIGKHVVIVGASNIVGRPMALALLNAKATVTICHSKTQNLEQHTRVADVLIIATGVFNVIKTDWLTSKQIIIDIGMHRNPDGRLHGDIPFEDARKKVAWITPVPGGVGPMTIAMLLENTFYAATLQELEIKP